MKISVNHILYNNIGGIGTLVDNIISFSVEFTSEKLFFQKKKYICKYNVICLLYLYIRLIKRINNRSNIIHIHGIWGPHLCLMRKYPGQKIIISPHGGLDRVSFKKNRYLKYIVWNLVSKWFVMNADCIIAATEREVQDIKKMLPSNGCPKIALIPNGINFETDLPVDRKYKEKYLELANGRMIFLSLSRIDKSKGIELLIDAFYDLYKQSPENILLIAGGGSEKYVNSLKEKINNYRLDEVIFFIGVVSGSHKTTIFDIADVFVLPSFNEGFGLTVLESYRQQVPVISTNATSFSEIKKNNIGWYIKPVKSELYEAMYSASTLSLDNLQYLGKKGYSIMSKNYSNNIFNKKLDKLYGWVSGDYNRPDFIL